MRGKALSIVAFYLLGLLSLPVHSAFAQDPFIGEIRLFGYTYCPRGWIEADGQLLPISQNEALFSLYGTTYGGDGRTNFALPDLRGRAPIHVGQGPGLSSYPLGQSGGAETVTLSVEQMPAHEHTFTELTNANGTTPGLAVRSGGGEQATATSQTGGSQAHENRSPYQVMRYCIALAGIYPSRN
jgi:microcystin-dependent protein